MSDMARPPAPIIPTRTLSLGAARDVRPTCVNIAPAAALCRNTRRVDRLMRSPP